MTDPARIRLARLAALGGIAAAVVLVALVMFAGGGGYTVRAVFQNAGQLVVGNQVLIGGTPVGSIEGIALTDDGRAEVEMRLERGTPRLHQGSTAVIRATSLSGIANRYVSIHPGPDSVREIPDGGRIAADDAVAPVDLDQLFDTLDPETRAGLQRVIDGFASQYDGKGARANEALRFFSPALATTSALTAELVRDQQAFEGFVVDGSRLVTAVAERRDDVAALVGNATTTTDAIGDENVALARALGLLPGTLRRSNTTFVNLRATLDDLDVLVAESKPATKDLAKLLRRLRPLVAGAKPTIRDLRLLIRRRGANNDLIELTSKAPRLADLAETAWPRAVRTLQRAQPVVEYARPYAPDVTGWLTKFGQGAAAYDANGHYARIQPIFSAFSFDDAAAGGVLNAVPPSQRLEGLETRRSQRCPGGATQPPPDGSAPFRPAAGFSCDPDAVPPGP